jgi:hypothetical protein
LKGGPGGELRPRDVRQRWRGGAVRLRRGVGREMRVATARERWCRVGGVHTTHRGVRERHGAVGWATPEKKQSGPSLDEQ